MSGARDSELQIVCTLDSGDHQRRIADWQRLVEGSRSEDVNGGVRVVVPSERAGELAALVVAEQHCCAFLDFTMTFDHSTVALTITAPPEAEELVRALVAPRDEPGESVTACQAPT